MNAFQKMSEGQKKVSKKQKGKKEKKTKNQKKKIKISLRIH